MGMKNYDMVYVIKPDLEPDAIKAVMDRMSQRIQDQGGTIEVVDVWGKKRSSYRLRKYRDGLYVHTRFALETTKVAELRRAATLIEEVLRTVLTNAVGPTPQPRALAAPGAAPTPTSPQATPPAPAQAAPLASSVPSAETPPAPPTEPPAPEG